MSSAADYCYTRHKSYCGPHLSPNECVQCLLAAKLLTTFWNWEHARMYELAPQPQQPWQEGNVWRAYLLSRCAGKHTHPFKGPFSGTTQVSRHQKGKTNLDFTEVRDSEWQWHQLGHMQVCTLLQTDNHTSTPPLSFLQAGCPSCRPTNSVKALKARLQEYTRKNKMSTIQCYEKSTTSFAQLHWEWFTNHYRHKKCFALRNFQHAPSPINWLFHHCFNLNSALYT